MPEATETQKPKTRRWLRWTLLGLFVVAWTVYGLAHYMVYKLPADSKLGTRAMDWATAFSIGLP